MNLPSTAPKHLWLLFAMSNAMAAERSLVSGPDLNFPSIWRVALVFLLVTVFAFVLAFLLRRMKPWLSARAAIDHAPHIVTVAQRQLTRTLSVHVVEVEGRRFMIVDSARHAAITPLAVSSERSAHKDIETNPVTGG